MSIGDDDWFLCSIGLMVLLSVHFLIDLLFGHGGLRVGIVRFLAVATLCFPAFVVLVAILYSLELYEGTASVVTAGRSATSVVGMAVVVGGAYGCVALCEMNGCVEDIRPLVYMQRRLGICDGRRQ